MHFFGNKNTKKVLVTLRDMCLVDIPPHGTPIFVKAKQSKYEFTSKSVLIQKNVAKWPDPIVIKSRIAMNQTDKHPHPLRLSFRFEDASGKDFVRYGIAEIDITTAFYENISNVEILLTNCTYNTKFKCEISVDSPSKAPSFPTHIPTNSISQHDQQDMPSLSVTEKSTVALVTNVATGGTTVSFQAPKKPHELAPVPITAKRYAELEAQVDELLSNIIIESADDDQTTESTTV